MSQPEGALTELARLLASGAVTTPPGRWAFRLDTSEWTLVHDDGATALLPGRAPGTGGALITDGDTLHRMVHGELDAMTASALGLLGFDGPDRESIPVVTLLMQVHNARHLAPPFVDHVLGRLLAQGRVPDREGNPVPTGGWCLPADVCLGLYRLVREGGLGRTLEVGLGFGASALAICQAHADAGHGNHVAVDPWQQGELFGGAGVHHLREAGLERFFELRHAPDHVALPGLVNEGNRFDLVLIDGLHMLDYALLDILYADLLLPVGGLLVLDDISLPAVADALGYTLANRAYCEERRFGARAAVLKKLREDDRAAHDVTFHVRW
ncbi:MAG: class I SAM-dependent methyltransferase [Deltaproteobacteria bacterium]|nr:class I SAM-dependent methyltransferase [Deltaproteobacteria bacterium]